MVESGGGAEARGEHVGVDDTGVEGDDGHPGRQLLGEGPGEALDGPLGCTVRGDERSTGSAPPGGHVDDDAFLHERDEVAQHIGGPFQVGINHPIELFHRNLPHLVVLVYASRTVHYHIRNALLLHHNSCHLLDAVVRLHVGVEEEVVVVVGRRS